MTYRHLAERTLHQAIDRFSWKRDMRANDATPVDFYCRKYLHFMEGLGLSFWSMMRIDSNLYQAMSPWAPERKQVTQALCSLKAPTGHER